MLCTWASCCNLPGGQCGSTRLGRRTKGVQSIKLLLLQLGAGGGQSLQL